MTSPPRRILRQGLLVAMIAACVMPPVGRAQPQSADRPPVIGGRCEGCQAVYEGLPEELAASARIAAPGDPGEPMRIEGIVRRADGTPAAGIIVYAYHTDGGGIYPRDEAYRGQAAYRHGKLRGWARTNENGYYSFDTVRPGGYPNSSVPQHVHMHVIEPACCTYYIESIEFTDDPRLGSRKPSGPQRGGVGIVTPRRSEKGVWLVERDIVLGQDVPGYSGRSPSQGTG